MLNKPFPEPSRDSGIEGLRDSVPPSSLRLSVSSSLPHGPFPPLCQKCAQEPEFVRLVRERLRSHRDCFPPVKRLLSALTAISSCAQVAARQTIPQLQADTLINIAVLCQRAAEDSGLLPPLSEHIVGIDFAHGTPEATDAHVLGGVEPT